MNALGVAVGGGLGALARYWVDGLVSKRQRSPFPLGTLAINVSGSALLGLVVGLATRGSLSTTAALWLGTGLIGGYTTFSTFTYETLRLIEDRAWGYAAWNVALSGPLSFAAAAATYLFAKGR
jgi:fluoride exporter